MLSPANCDLGYCAVQQKEAEQYAPEAVYVLLGRLYPAEDVTFSTEELRKSAREGLELAPLRYPKQVEYVLRGNSVRFVSTIMPLQWLFDKMMRGGFEPRMEPHKEGRFKIKLDKFACDIHHGYGNGCNASADSNGVLTCALLYGQAGWKMGPHKNMMLEPANLIKEAWNRHIRSLVPEPYVVNKTQAQLLYGMLRGIPAAWPRARDKEALFAAVNKCIMAYAAYSTDHIQDGKCNWCVKRILDGLTPLEGIRMWVRRCEHCGKGLVCNLCHSTHDCRAGYVGLGCESCLLYTSDAADE